MKTIGVKVPVKFEGEVFVTIPADTPEDRRRELFASIAHCYVEAEIGKKSDQPVDYYAESYCKEADTQEERDAAYENWCDSQANSVSGDWTIEDTSFDPWYSEDKYYR